MKKFVFVILVILVAIRQMDSARKKRRAIRRNLTLLPSIALSTG